VRDQSEEFLIFKKCLTPV